MLQGAPAMVFIENKYFKIYFALINRAKLRTLEGYTEKHHIIPRSLGGNNTKSNLAILTGREHFICHLLLTKIVEGKNKSKMVFALNSMMNRRNDTMDRYVPNSKFYERLRILLSEAHKQIGRSEAHKLAISKRHKGKIVSEETKKKMSESSKSKIVGGAVKGSVRSASTKAKISQARKGIIFSDEHKKKLSEAAKNRKKKHTLNTEEK